ncbi:hypothetical protein G9A89_002383 [Geosiphon pyriformis]|nr:hypothetical protein G9A89_002383 [Geosiphon pyriformis]
MDPIAKIGDWIVIPFKTKKLSPQRTSKVLYVKEILSKKILEKILQAVLIKAIEQVFVKTPSHSYDLGIINTQASFQGPSTDLLDKQEFKSTKSISKINLS